MLRFGIKCRRNTGTAGPTKSTLLSRSSTLSLSVFLVFRYIDYSTGFNRPGRRTALFLTTLQLYTVFADWKSRFGFVVEVAGEPNCGVVRYFTSESSI